MGLLAVGLLLFCFSQFEAPVAADDGPLLLTSYIKQGKYKEAKKAAKVNLWKQGIWNLESYSGFITVDETYDSNLFFWYFPAKKNADTAPLALWLQGGPGNFHIVISSSKLSLN